MHVAHIIKGAIWVALAYFPLIFWYSWRYKAITKNKDQNTWYFWTWNFMMLSHSFVFSVPALLFPFTFFNNLIVNRFYILTSYWVGLIAGGFITSITTLLFIVTLATHTDIPSVSRRVIAIELGLYLLFTLGTAFFSNFMLDDSTNTYLQLTAPDSQRNWDGSTGNPEGSENQPISPIGHFIAI